MLAKVDKLLAYAQSIAKEEMCGIQKLDHDKVSTEQIEEQIQIVQKVLKDKIVPNDIKKS